MEHLLGIKNAMLLLVLL